MIAPGKVNLSLFVGAPREDGLHPLVSVVQAVTLADDVTMEPAASDEVICLGIEGPNLATKALNVVREATGWTEPQRITITKRIPVAAGMGGGSSDAAAVLRLAAAAAGITDPARLDELAFGVGADVPSLLDPGRVLMTGAGEHVDRLPDPVPFGLVIVPSPQALSTPAVYAEFDRRGGGRPPDELEVRAAAARAGDPPPPVNDLQDAALALCPEIAPVLRQVEAAGATVAMVSGSGPTVFGLFEDLEAAQAAAATHPGAIAVEPLR